MKIGLLLGGYLICGRLLLYLEKNTENADIGSALSQENDFYTRYKQQYEAANHSHGAPDTNIKDEFANDVRRAINGIKYDDSRTLNLNQQINHNSIKKIEPNNKTQDNYTEQQATIQVNAAVNEIEYLHQKENEVLRALEQLQKWTDILYDAKKYILENYERIIANVTRQRTNDETIQRLQENNVFVKTSRADPIDISLGIQEGKKFLPQIAQTTIEGWNIPSDGDDQVKNKIKRTPSAEDVLMFTRIYGRPPRNTGTKDHQDRIIVGSDNS